ncbi:MAG: hypothetical protein AAF840_14300 [Bacteroidota bacterium]
MRILLLFLLLGLSLPAFSQLEVRFVANSHFTPLPSSDYNRVRSGASRAYRLPPISFAAGLELAYINKKNDLPSFIGLTRGFVVGSNLSADFKGEAERCKDGSPAGITPVFAQVRLQGVNYWQLYGQIGVAKIPELRQLTFSVGGGLTVFSRQRLHQAQPQLSAPASALRPENCPP